MRVLAIVAGGLALILIGCGSSAVSSPPASETPAPSPSQAVMRNLNTGEDVALACGLTLTVPAGYHGYYAAGEPGSDAPLDFVASERLAQTSFMHSFSAQSFASTSTLGPNGLSWPLVASSGDGTVEVHSDAIRLGTPKAVSMISVVIHLPDRPAGQVSMMGLRREGVGCARRSARPGELDVDAVCGAGRGAPVGDPVAKVLHGKQG